MEFILVFDREKVNILMTKSFVTLEGAGADSTVIQWGDMAGTLGPDGKPLGTYNSATVAVNSPYFIAKNITFKVRFGISYFKCFLFRIGLYLIFVLGILDDFEKYHNV